MNTFSPRTTKVFKSALLFIFLLGLQADVAAQPWMNNGGDTLKNFYDIQRNFNEYWQGRTIEKGKGWKQFKRWEWFWEQRVAPTGEFPNPMQLLLERPVLKDSDKDKKTDKILGTAVTNPWSSIGPSQSTGGYSGIGRVNCITTLPSDPNTIWVGGASGGVWKSTNGGSSWSTVTDLLPTLGVGDIAIDPTNTNTMYLATGDGDHFTAYSVGVLKSTDGGATWGTTGLNYNTTQTVRMSRILINPNATNTLLVGATNGIYRSTNGGTNWTQVATGDFKDLEFKPGDPSIVYGGRSNGAVFRSTNGGANWTQITSGLPTSNAGRVALAVSPDDPAVVYALFAHSSTSGFRGLYISVDSGVTWAAASTTPNILDGSADGTDTGGQGWYDLALAVSPTDASDVYVGGINVWRSQDAGQNWTKLTHWYNMSGYATVHADQHCLYFPSGSNRIFLGNDGGIYTSTNNGTSWSWIGSGLRITQFYRLGTSATNANKVIAGAQDNGTKLYNGSTWSDVAGGDGMEAAIDPANENILFAAIQNGELLRSTNGGTNFTAIRPISTGGAWITPYTLNPLNSQAIYAGYVNVWKSLNRGTTWTQISNFSGGSSLNILKVAPSDSNTIYASTGTSTLRRTTNGGGAWTSLSLPVSNTLTYLAIHPTDPQKIWATFSGYSAGNKVYYSANGGTSWTNVSGSLPNIPVNCIVYQNNSPDRLYIGTDVGVYYTDNTLSDWSDYNQSLPNVIIDELEIQYSSGKIRAATYGRGVWEAAIITGSLTAGTLASSACAGNPFSVPFITGDAMNTGNVFTAQLSNATGSFANPVNIGTLSGTSSGTISAVIPSNTPAGNGYKIRVVSTSPALISSPAEATITIYSKPTPSLSGSEVVCSGNSSQFTTTAAPGVTNFWVITGGTITGASNRDTVIVNWGMPGQGTVKLIQTLTTGGCVDSISAGITISPLPEPAFTGVTAVCPGTTAVYTAAASGEWKAVNGTVIGASTGSSVLVSWGKTGDASLKFIQTSAAGCKDSSSQNITFKSNLAAAISGETSTCKGSSVVYSAQTTSGVSYLWSVTGGTISGSPSAQSVSVQWGENSAGSILLIQTDLTALCSDTASSVVNLMPPPIPVISGDFQNISNGTTATYTAPSNPGGTNTWIAYGGTIISADNEISVNVLWNTTGAGSLKLIQTNEYSCVDSTLQTFTIKAPSAVSISGVASVCENSEHSYSIPLESGMTAAWILQGGQVKTSSGNSATILWQTPGAAFLKAVRTITATGFKDTADFSVTVNALPAKPVITKNPTELVSSAPIGNQWFKNGAAVSGATGKNFTPVASGMYSVQVKSADNCQSEISDEVEFIIVSVLESGENQPVKITPNPAQNYISIECQATDFEKVVLQLVDLHGKEVLKTEMTAGVNLLKGVIDLHSVANGTYFLNIQTSLKTYTVKISVSH